MFSLIITIISIVLVIVLAAATIYYGGTSYFSSADKATATRLSLEAEHIRTAIQMYQTDHQGKLPDSLEDLTKDGVYLKNTPDNWGGSTNFFSNSYDVNKDVCLQFNTERGLPLVPECTDEVYRYQTVCCRNKAPVEVD